MPCIIRPLEGNIPFILLEIRNNAEKEMILPCVLPYCIFYNHYDILFVAVMIYFLIWSSTTNGKDPFLLTITNFLFLVTIPAENSGGKKQTVVRFVETPHTLSNTQHDNQSTVKKLLIDVESSVVCFIPTTAPRLLFEIFIYHLYLYVYTTA